MQDRQGQMIPESSRPVHRPYDLLVSILLCTKLVKDVKQTRYSRLWHVYHAKNSSEAGISLLDVERINMI